ncbi:hypothetical protein PssvBMR6_gp09 [Pseudomonas phage MR6]|uniref:Uncharacterized protein n=1 Tax=Pseudomonas phage MR5 TaxID=2711172 RepID=A0A6M3TCP0_9CAUD|nr:hypothetical protein PssvBMR5_gp09 [Pseudomonas phage MR5]QJD54837.1 hypothetical protein PssvBMR6_gp09 [Pseudomonas phage MR6]QJD54896.1 hypothetical protein PssvBMR7_gp09 [Pseudomonas phage MR7]QJF74578.1 hypothetical protein PssvBMR16_gp09 [Pseudomonas phage MR16]
MSVRHVHGFAVGPARINRELIPMSTDGIPPVAY